MDIFKLSLSKTNLTGEEVQFIGKYNEIIFKAFTKQLMLKDLKKYSLSEERVVEIVSKFSTIKHSFGDGITVKFIEQTKENK